MKINSETVLNPRAYEGAVFEMIPGTDNFPFRQNTIHGGHPTVQFYSPAKACTCHGDCEIPNMYNKASVNILIADICNEIYLKTTADTLTPNIDLISYYIKAETDTLTSNVDLSNYYIKAETDTLFSNIDLSTYYAKSEVDGIDNELPTLVLNTYTKAEVDNLIC